MTTKVIIRHEGTLPKDKNLLISRRYDDMKKKEMEVLLSLKPGGQIVTFAWKGAIIEIKEEK
jgi:preprotein translocase subunit YajC